MNELFESKRTLVLVLEDVATSDDPLEAFLQRKGWDLQTIREMQESISRKMTPGLFSGKTEELSYKELLLQRHVDQFIKQNKGVV